jgi:hypothetical protein
MFYFTIDYRRFEMTTLMINDLESSKELDHGTMLAVRGGVADANQFSFNAQELVTDTKAGLVAISNAAQILTSIDNQVNLDIHPETVINLGSPASL